MARKFQRARSLFFSDVFIGVAVVGFVRSLMFLDRDGHLYCRKREEKNRPTVSFWVQSWRGKLHMSILRLFLQYLRNHALLRSRNSATKTTVRDVTVSFVEGLIKTTPALKLKGPYHKICAKLCFPTVRIPKIYSSFKRIFRHWKIKHGHDDWFNNYACKNHH